MVQGKVQPKVQPKDNVKLTHKDAAIASSMREIGPNGWSYVQLVRTRGGEPQNRVRK